MKFKESKYYNKELLGENLYNLISDINQIFTVQEYFGINDTQKEYHVKEKGQYYNLKVFDTYYEFSCEDYKIDLYLIFDKTVYAVGKHCRKIIAPKIIVKSGENSLLSCCVANEVIINNDCVKCYEINYSKINSIHFYNSKVTFWDSKVKNFFIFNQELIFGRSSNFLNCHKIKVFGSCNNLKEKILIDKNFKEGIIHIE